MTIGTPLTASATRALLLGSGELGKEVAIELQRLGIEVIACDRYADAPAMQVAHRSHVVDMLDGDALRAVIERERPHLVIPEIEAIATEELTAIEESGVRVVPRAYATRMTMDREGIRRLAAEQLGLLTSPYRFVESADDLVAAAPELGFPLVVKPVMSSSGRGQTIVRRHQDLVSAWAHAQAAGRGSRKGRGGTRSGARHASTVIAEGFVEFDYEITLLTIRHAGGTTFLDPIGHLQVDGDYRESWQPQPMSVALLEEAHEMARAVTDALGGWGVFGVELFVAGDRVLFSEVSPRPHDTGLVTLVSQDLSEFALHVRAILGLPIPHVARLGPSASCAIVAEGVGVPVFHRVDEALAEPGSDVRLFGKPRVEGHRRVAVALARGETLADARAIARTVADTIQIELTP
jgi:phosphoribosylglycinamide formyltransferase 2